MSRNEDVSAGAVGGMVFAATIMMMVGLFQVITGLVAIIDDEFFLVAPNYTFKLDVSAWGWIHLVVGLLVAGAGYSLLNRRTTGAVVAIFIAVLSATANFFFIPYYPVWSLLIIALDVWVIWAVTRPGSVA